MLTTSTELSTLETIIQDGLQTFFAVGNALLEIRAKRLYKPVYATFEDYCRQRFDMGRNYANKLIGAANVMSNLGTNVTKPTNEAQTRALAQLAPDEQRLVWQVVEQTAIEGQVTAAHVKLSLIHISEPTRPY